MTAPPAGLDELATVAMSAVPAGAADVRIRDVTIDSRAVGPDTLFCCVRGGTVDGHDYAADAVAAGAVALVVDRDPSTLAPAASGVPVLRVPDVRAVLGPLADAAYGRPSAAMRVVGITGTNGKTSTAFLTAAVLGAAGAEVGVTGTVETRYAGVREAVTHTTPDAASVHRLLARMRDAGCDMAVMEVSSHALDQGRVDAVRFAAAAFTNLTQDHLDYHETMQAYFDAKARLFASSRTAAAAINVADPWGVTLCGRTDVADLWPFAAGTPAPGAPPVRVRMQIVAETAATLGLRLDTAGQSTNLTLGFGGSFQAENAAAAATVGLALGLAPESVAAGLASAAAVPGRFEPVRAGQDFDVLVDYAHTPDGVAHVLDAARAVVPDGCRLHVVLGCGGDRDRAKRPLMAAAAATRADHVVLTSDNPRSEDPLAIIDDMRPGLDAGGAQAEIEPDRRGAIRIALAAARPGDVVVIAGKGHETGQTALGVTTPFDDRAVAAEELAAIVAGASSSSAAGSAAGSSGGGAA